LVVMDMSVHAGWVGDRRIVEGPYGWRVKPSLTQKMYSELRVILVSYLSCSRTFFILQTISFLCDLHLSSRLKNCMTGIPPLSHIASRVIAKAAGHTKRTFGTPPSIRAEMKHQCTTGLSQSRVSIHTTAENPLTLTGPKATG
jgi:hypothetical protein